MKHIKDLMIKSAIAKIRTYEIELEEARQQGNEAKVKQLQTMIDEWRKILEDLLLN